LDAPDDIVIFPVVLTGTGVGTVIGIIDFLVNHFLNILHSR